MSKENGLCRLCLALSAEFKSEEGLLEHYRRAHMDEMPSAYWELKEKMLTRSWRVLQETEQNIGAVA